jgi:hypothetical protein
MATFQKERFMATSLVYSWREAQEIAAGITDSLERLQHLAKICVDIEPLVGEWLRKLSFVADGVSGYADICHQKEYV